MLSQIQFLLSLSDPQQELRVNLALESVVGLLQESDCRVERSVLTRHLDRNNSVLEWVDLCGQVFDHGGV